MLFFGFFLEVNCPFKSGKTAENRLESIIGCLCALIAKTGLRTSSHSTREFLKYSHPHLLGIAQQRAGATEILVRKFNLAGGVK